jgi:UDP-N-acetylglucosamine 3-dehydrogenase
MSFTGMSDKLLRAGVIGLGAMGRHHVRVYNDLPSVTLTAVADVSASAVDRTVGQYHVDGYTDIDAMLDAGNLDLVSIVVPTSLHHEVVLKAIDRGTNVLVEKPIASTVEEAREMIDAADRAGVRLMVGHIERFNPAILELKRRIEQVGTIFQISARRVGPFPDRIRDVGVVIDLASHDIDAMNFILESPVEFVYAQTAQRVHTSHEDMVLGTLRFTNGALGSLEVNWLTATKIRQLTVVGAKGTFVADYLSQDLAFYQNGAIEDEWDDLRELQRISEGHATRYAFARVEPLRAELDAFVRSVIDDTPVPADPQGAESALLIAESLIKSASSNSIVAPFDTRVQIRI